jgi:hypothetical protein
MTISDVLSDISLVWIPYPEHGKFHGRLLARRRTAMATDLSDDDDAASDDGPVTEVWLSPVIDETALLTAALGHTPDHWRELLLGRPLHSMWAAVDLRPATERELREVLARLGGSGSGSAHRTLLDAAVELDRPAGRLAIRSVCIELASTDLLAQALRPMFDETVTGLAAAERTENDVAPELRRTLAEDLHACICMQGVRGAVIGDHNHQIDRYTVVTKPGTVSFDEVLGRPDVLAALRDLQQTPDNSAARQRLISALSGSLLLTPEPAQLVITGADSGGAEGFLDNLLAFRVKGLQVGDHNTQINEITYVVPTTPDATHLLHTNHDLARALADVLCPHTGDAPNVAELDARYRHVLTKLDIAYRDGRERAVQHNMPAPDSILRLTNIDGVTVGEQNRLTRSDTVHVDAVSFEDLRIVWERAEKRRVEIAQEQETARLEKERAVQLEQQRISEARLERERQKAIEVEQHRPQRFGLGL